MMARACEAEQRPLSAVFRLFGVAPGQAGMPRSRAILSNSDELPVYRMVHYNRWEVAVRKSFQPGIERKLIEITKSGHCLRLHI